MGDPMNNVNKVWGIMKGKSRHTTEVSKLSPGLTFRDAVDPMTKAQLGMGEIKPVPVLSSWVTKRK